MDQLLRKKQIGYLQNAIVYSMLDMLELRDGYTGSHVQHVEDYVHFMLEELSKESKWGISGKEIHIISQSVLLHDIGKIAIPDSVLLKQGKLTQEEFNIIKMHTTLGAHSLKKTMDVFDDSDFMQTAYDIAKYHHERWDGSGYPKSLKHEDIPFSARITAIADVYDALRSKRPYKDVMDRWKARDIIIEGKGSHFDPDLVDIFLRVEPKFDNYCRSTGDAKQWR